MLRERHTSRYLRYDRGGAVLIAWDPPPFFLREGYTDRCGLIFVALRALAPDQDAPPPPDHGCQ